MPRVITGNRELESSLGELGVSDWREVTQEVVDRFADATGDHYWVHTDPVRAGRSPVGTTIAHGLLTLGLGPMLMHSIASFEGFSIVMNYGYDRVRFVDPVPVGSRVRLRATLTEVRAAGNGMRAHIEQSFERDGGQKPACVALQVLHLVE